MADTDGKAKYKWLRFEESHQPGLVAGEYSITLEHWIKTEKATPLRQAGAAKYGFSLAAPRFVLNPQDVSAVFPPAGSLGDHSSALPHIQLRRSTLPWERQPHEKDGSWLTLLVLHEDELGTGASRKIQSETVPLQKLQNASEGSDGIWWRGVTPETRLGQHGEDPVSIIDVDANLLKAVFPAADERKWLTHVRYKTEDEKGLSTGEERAVIIGNRLPALSGTTIVHLVSLEGRDIDAEIHRASQAAGPQKVRFVSLHSWRFDCVSHTQSFKGLLLNLNRSIVMQLSNGSKLLPPGSSAMPESLARALQQIGGTFETGSRLELVNDDHWISKDGTHEFHIRRERDHLIVTRPMPGVLRLPAVANADAEAYLNRGAVALAHTTRAGNQTVSWYHGPLVPGTVSSPPIEFPIPAADKVVHYNPSIGMLDVSYAVAWELGRLLTLQNKAVATALYNWKRRHTQADKLEQAEAQWLHLPFRPQSSPSDLPGNVADWFRDLSVLRGVPFRYLVPDERMLPAESLRFFQIDPQWIQCLLDGAFSIGRVVTSDHSRDAAHTERLTADLKPETRASGLLLRSTVVSGWPDLLVDAYDQSGPLTKLREDKLSPAILLSVFEGVVQKVDIHQKPEALHFGFSAKEGSKNGFTRGLRDKQGRPSQHGVDVPVSEHRVVGWQELVKSITESASSKSIYWETNATSGCLAFQLIEGVELVRFKVD
jgi:hypothetical protein